MMSKIGSKTGFPARFLSSGGFTLIEVLIASTILVMGTLLLHQTYLRLSDIYGRYLHSIQVKRWAAEKLAERCLAVRLDEDFSPSSSGGELMDGGRAYQWNEETRSISGKNLYAVDLSLDWLESGKPFSISRKIYAFRKNFQS